MPNASVLVRMFAAGAVTGLVGFLARLVWLRRARRANPAHERLTRHATTQYHAKYRRLS